MSQEQTGVRLPVLECKLLNYCFFHLILFIKNLLLAPTQVQGMASTSGMVAPHMHSASKIADAGAARGLTPHARMGDH
jgi:hypothetical protein